MFKDLFGDKPWYQSLTAWGLLILALGTTYGGYTEMPFAELIGAWSLKGGAILAGLGIRRAISA